MPPRRRARFVALTQLLSRQFPHLDDAASTVASGRVVVDGRTITNPNARVRSNASIRLAEARQLRGEWKLGAALDAFHLDIRGLVVVDVGAAAGGFASALVGRGAARVYAVDVGFGQLAGWLRADPRVINLERTNVAALDYDRVPEVVDLVTMDLSYLPIADAVHHLGRLQLAPDAMLVALVKPTFELKSGSLVATGPEVRTAIRVAIQAIEAARWQALASTLPRASGARGAVEAFVLARRNRLRGRPRDALRAVSSEHRPLTHLPPGAGAPSKQEGALDARGARQVGRRGRPS